MFPCVSLDSCLLPVRGDTCGTVGATCSGRSSMAGVNTGRREAVGQMKKTDQKKGIYAVCQNPLSQASPWSIAHCWKLVWASFLESG